jgi:glutathione-specific gamma-glutamylcyclotransferase
MLLPPEAFKYVPALAGKIFEPEKSFLRLSRERLNELDRAARENGYPADWRLTDEAREATRKALLGGHTGNLWIFAYGSLMWDPAIHIVEIRMGMLQGFHRRFCLKSHIGRGSREKPALMAGLDDGGSCAGLAFRVPAETMDRETEILWMREMIAGTYLPTMVPVETPQGPIEALTFVMNRNSSRYVRLDLEETARIIATGRGLRGTCLEYLENLAERLDLLGLRDPDIDELRARVREILHPSDSASVEASDTGGLAPDETRR